MEPKVYIYYLREAFVNRDSEDLRITFDQKYPLPSNELNDLGTLYRRQTGSARNRCADGSKKRQEKYLNGYRWDWIGWAKKKR